MEFLGELMRGASLPCFAISVIRSMRLIAGAACIILALDVSVGRASTAQTVDQISFAGNGTNIDGTSDYNLRTAMVQQFNPPFTWLLRPAQRRVFLNRQELMTDGWRIETWYAHRGYFDASFQGWQVTEVYPAIRFGPWNSPAKVKVLGSIEEGKPSEIRSVEWDGLDGVGVALISHLRRQILLQSGDRFDLTNVEESRDIVRSILFDRSYAKAEVDIAVEAFPEQHAVDIQVVINLGPGCSFGDIRFEGDYRAPKARIEDAVTFKEGDKYRGSALSETQKSLFGLGIFSVVNIVPEVEKAHQGVVPIRIELSESKPRELRLGGGMGWEAGKKEVHVSGDFSHSNLWGRLVRLEVNNDIGLASLSNLDDVEWSEDGGIGSAVDDVSTELVQTTSPVVSISALAVIPGVPSPYIDLEQNVAFEVGVEPGYRFSSAQASPGLRLDVDAWLRDKGRLGRRLRGWDIHGSLRYSLERFSFLEFSLDESLINVSPLGLDITEEYFLSSIQQEFSFDTRNDVLFTREGVYGTYTLTEAGGPLRGRYNFVRGTFDQRGYLPLLRLRDQVEELRKRANGKAGRSALPVRSEQQRNFARKWLRLTGLAGRVSGGFIIPYGADERATVPYAERLTLGGSNTVRGWALNHIGPYAYHPDTALAGEGSPGQAQLSSEIIPLGGLISLQGSGELRVYGDNDFGLVMFVDVGNVWRDRETFQDFSLLPSVGIGARYVTPIGPFRIDLGRRLDQEPMYSELNRWALHLSFSEAY